VEDMTNSEDLKHDKLDRELDAALAKFAAVEPRTGLEERILANLRAEQGRAIKRSWWRWPAIAALAAMILVVVSVVWKSAKPEQNMTAQHPPVTTHVNEHVANNGGRSLVHRHAAGTGRSQVKPQAISRQTAAVASPKLEQFPSPRPLSEQERILESYVANFPEHATLIARARTEALRRDAAEEMTDGEAESEKDSRQ